MIYVLNISEKDPFLRYLCRGRGVKVWEGEEGKEGDLLLALVARKKDAQEILEKLKGKPFRGRSLLLWALDPEFCQGEYEKLGEIFGEQTLLYTHSGAEKLAKTLEEVLQKESSLEEATEEEIELEEVGPLQFGWGSEGAFIRLRGRELQLGRTLLQAVHALGEWLDALKRTGEVKLVDRVALTAGGSMVEFRVLLTEDQALVFTPLERSGKLVIGVYRRNEEGKFEPEEEKELVFKQ